MGDFGHVYFDSSVIVRRTFQEPGSLHHISFRSAVASELLEVEVMRAIGNRRVTQALGEEKWLHLRTSAQGNLAGIHLVPLDQVVLKRAMSTFPTAVGTLDAIHLATALLWADYVDRSLTFLTHDRQLAIAALSCGLDVYPKPVLPV